MMTRLVFATSFLPASASFRPGRLARGLCALALCATPAMAQTLLQHPQARLEVDDLLADWARLPAAQQSLVRTNPGAIRQQADALLVRRVLAERALSEGLANDPLVQRQLQIARERVLSDALLARVDARAVADPKAVEDMARLRYQAQPERFAVPEQVRVRHILLTGDDAEARAQALLAQLRSGALSFEAAAREHSKDPGSAARGGDLGFFGRGRMVAPFEEAAFALQQPGDLAGPVRTDFGVHVLQLVERRPAGRLPFDEVRDTLVQEVERALRNQARTELRDGILKEVTADDAAIANLVEPAPAQ
ncbi:peptidylprolyl isomerase [Tepidimonas taiwanensis]|nr:peptidylprolyl isomerase [Tepidimonas taiwanensis]UBQ04953.1 peptidylprolyl isomerase [Tepidimonas taiwanensis]